MCTRPLVTSLGDGVFMMKEVIYRAALVWTVHFLGGCLAPTPEGLCFGQSEPSDDPFVDNSSCAASETTDVVDDDSSSDDEISSKDDTDVETETADDRVQAEPDDEPDLVDERKPHVFNHERALFSDDFWPGFLDEVSGSFVDRGEQVRDAFNGTAVVISSASAPGDQAVISSRNMFERDENATFLYRLIVRELLPPEDGDGLPDPSMVRDDRAEVRTFFGAVSATAERRAIPYFEPNAALLTLVGDYVLRRGRVTLESVSLVLSAKSNQPRSRVGTDVQFSRWLLNELPSFPLILEFAIGPEFMRVGVYNEFYDELELIGEPPTVRHSFGSDWLTDSLLVIGAENGDEVAGACAIDSVSVEPL